MTYESKRVYSGERVLNTESSVFSRNAQSRTANEGLSSLRYGERAAVYGFADNGRNISSRLRDIGVTKGTVIECVGRSPLGDPCAFKIRGAVIALRKEDSDVIIIRQPQSMT